MKRKHLAAVLLLGAMVALENASAVGYYTVNAAANSFTFIAVQLKPANNNYTITNLLGTPPPGAVVYEWNTTNQAFVASTWDEDNLTWNPNFTMPLGKGLLVYTPQAWSITFIGDPPLGTMVTPVPGGNKLSLLASQFPQSGKLSTDLSFPGLDGANVYLYRGAATVFSNAFTFFSGFGWYNPSLPGPGEPVPAVGESFFVQNFGSDTVWTRTFNLAPDQEGALAAGENTEAAKPAVLEISNGSVWLKGIAPADITYKVQFSADGKSWVTVARNQTGPTWQGTFPGGRQGYYRLVYP